MFIIAVSSCHIEPLLIYNVLCLLEVFKSNLPDNTIPSLLSFYFQFHCCCSVTPSCPTLWDPMDCSMPGFPVLHHLPEVVQPHVHWVSDATQTSCPPSSPSPPAFNLSSIKVFSNESVLCIRWPKHRNFSFSINPFNEYSGLISFRIDWFDPLAVQGTLKSLLQHHSSKASVFKCSTFFIVQLSHPYITTGKTIALTRWTFVCKVMSLLFNMLSMLVIDFFLRHKRLLISWLKSPSAVIWEPKKIVSHCFLCFPMFAKKWPNRCHDLCF